MENQYICVVGGAGGIGRAVVQRYAARPGSFVLVVDRQPFQGDASINIETMVADVTSPNEIISLASNFKNRGIVISHLISLAGGALSEEWSALESIPDEAIERSIHLNLTSHVMLVKHLMWLQDVPLGDRSIIFVSSINAIRSYGLTAYSAAKAGLLGLTRELAGSLAPQIRVNAILPGTIETPRTKKTPKDFNALKEKTLLKRFAMPEDIAATCYFLTHMTNAITGTEIIVDAGQNVSTK
ncbi:MAG: SDR family oxidoreductase [bacterium]|nr:SDR family oxidoreductase [bacterium]